MLSELKYAKLKSKIFPLFLNIGMITKYVTAYNRYFEFCIIKHYTDWRIFIDYSVTKTRV